MVTCSSDLGCSIGIRVTGGTRIALSKLACAIVQVAVMSGQDQRHRCRVLEHGSLLFANAANVIR